MQPFNITIGTADSCQLYTILPESSYYAILIDDRIVGAIAEKSGDWIEVPLAKVHSHDLEIKSSGLHQQGSFMALPVGEIGKQISLILAGLPEKGHNKECR